MYSSEAAFYKGIDRHLRAAQHELNDLAEPNDKRFSRIMSELDRLIDIEDDSHGYKGIEVLLMGWGWQSYQDPDTNEILTICSPRLFAEGQAIGFKIIDLEAQTPHFNHSFRSNLDKLSSDELCAHLRQFYNVARFAIVHSVITDRMYQANSFSTEVSVRYLGAVASPATSIVVPKITASNMLREFSRGYFKDLCRGKPRLIEQLDDVDDILSENASQLHNFAESLSIAFQEACKYHPEHTASVSAYICHSFQEKFQEGQSLELLRVLPLKYRSENGQLMSIEVPKGFYDAPRAATLTGFEIDTRQVLLKPNVIQRQRKPVLYAVINIPEIAGPVMVNIDELDATNIRYNT